MRAGCACHTATAEDAAYDTFELDEGIIAVINPSWATRVHRDELVEFHVDGTEGSAVVGRHHCVTQHRDFCHHLDVVVGP